MYVYHRHAHTLAFLVQQVFQGEPFKKSSHQRNG